VEEGLLDDNNAGVDNLGAVGQDESFESEDEDDNMTGGSVEGRLRGAAEHMLRKQGGNNYDNYFENAPSIKKRKRGDNNNRSGLANLPNQNASLIKEIDQEQQMSETITAQITSLQQILAQSTQALQQATQLANSLTQQQATQLQLQQQRSLQRAALINGTTLSNTPNQEPLATTSVPQSAPQMEAKQQSQPPKKENLRRKKPRLEDSEARLEQLKAENETLKGQVERVLKRKEKGKADKDKQKKEVRER